MTAFYQDRAQAEAAVEMLKAFAQPQRLMILSCLLAGERAVGEIGAATDIRQPALSQQLAELRRKALVRARRQGTQMFYALADDKIRDCMRSMEAMLGNGERQPANPARGLLSAADQHREAAENDHPAMRARIHHAGGGLAADQNGGRTFHDRIGRADADELVPDHRGNQAADQH